MLSHNQKEFQKILQKATQEEIIWMKDLLLELFHEKPAERKIAVSACSVVYGTETGNSKKLALNFATQLKKQGVQVKIKSLDQYRLNDLEKETHFLVIISTHGDGEPPEAAKKFYNHIHSQELSLPELRFAVLALGDTAYPLFCKAGEDVDKRFAVLQAKRTMELKKCDIDFEEAAKQWFEEWLAKVIYSHDSIGVVPNVEQKKAIGSGRKICEAKVLTAIHLNDHGSNKETYHIELETDDPIHYEPGDSLAIVPMNNKKIVEEILRLLGVEESSIFEYKGTSETALSLFSKKINLQYLPERVIKQYAELTQHDIPNSRMDLIDLLRLYSSASVTAQQVIAVLDPMAPRLYSISSSPAAHGLQEVHITVSKHSFVSETKKQFGLCSCYLSGLQVGERLHVYVQKNNAFRLPPHDVDVIMIGPGTGIAPFRSFLFQRDAVGASGRNWLFFGEQHFVSDFLYQTELQSLYQTGVLTKLNTAFSRDQKEKIYVQNKLRQNGDEVLRWLDNGAHLYICGAKDPMSLDVENALVHILAQKKNLSLDSAKEQLQLLREADRIHMDVY